MIGTAPSARCVSLESAAAYLSVSRATIYRLINRGDIVAARIGTRRLVDLDSVDAHLADLRKRLVELGNPGESGLPATLE